MQEVYRSFENVLDVETREGYIIYEIKEFYEIHFLSVYADVKDDKFRVAKEALNPKDFDNVYKISELAVEVGNGCRLGQTFYKGKWYSQELINKIQSSHKDYDWKKHIGK